MFIHFVSIYFQCFEGMKAFRGDDNKIRLFRPMENMRRLNRSADRACLPVCYFVDGFLKVYFVAVMIRIIKLIKILSVKMFKS